MAAEKIENRIQQFIKNGLQIMSKESGKQFEVAPANLLLLLKYYTELQKWSKKMNLVSKTADSQEIIDKHFLDSLTLLPYLQQDNTHLLDIGSGAGFPGLVCKTALPTLSVSLVEPRLKRISFLRHIARTLPVANTNNGICAIHQFRLTPGDALPTPLMQEQYTHITARAVSDVASLLQLVSGFIGSNTTLLLMKGANWQSELDNAKDILKEKKYQLADVQEVRLPYSGIMRYILELRF